MSPAATAAKQQFLPATQTRPGYEAVIEVLKEQGVERIFGYPGGAILPIYEGLETVGQGIHHVLTAAEAGAGHMAAGYARATGKTGVLFVTSGPGLTNAVTPIADAQGDSTPMVVISGQVPTSMIGTDAFQEVPATEITRSITKHNILVNDPAMLVQAMRDAFRIAAEGRPGVVHIDIPKDVQKAMVEMTPPLLQSTKPSYKAGRLAFDRAAELMANAKRPIFYVGGGVIHAGPQASENLRDMLDMTGFPATSTLMGLGAYPTAHPSHLGMLGMHGAYEANMAMHDADVIIAVGARFDDRVTGRVRDAQGIRTFAPDAKIIHIDIDAAEISKIIRAEVALQGDAGATLGMLSQFLKTKDRRADISAWWQQIAQWRAVKSFEIDPTPSDDIRAQNVLAQLGRRLEKLDDYVVSTNVGQHQMWSAQHLPFAKPRQFLTSGKVGTMGYGLPAAIGAQFARPDVPSIVITGDGSWRMNANEVETACRYNLPIKVINLNNQSLNMVGQWGRNNHNGCTLQSVFANSTKDFCGEFKAQGHNAWGEKITHPSQVENAFKRMMAYNAGPYYLEIMIRNEDCLPIVEAGRDHNDIKHMPEAAARLKALGLHHG